MGLPEGWVLRPTQVEAVARIEAAFASGKKVVVVQGPTGSGKSLIGVAAALAAGRSYYLVPLKALQDQIASDFKDTLHVFKGKANYTCTQYPSAAAAKALEANQNLPLYTVDVAPCQDRGMSEQRKKCRKEECCPYYNAFEAAAEGDHALMNFSVFLAWMRLRQVLPPERAPFGQRPLHIIDEAHKVEDFIRDFLTVELSGRKLKKYLELDYASYEDLSEETLQEFFEGLIKLNDAALENLRKYHNTQDLEALTTEIGSEKLEFHLKLSAKLEAYFKEPDNYVFAVEERYAYGELNKYIIVKPLSVGGFISSQVVGERTLLLSATIPKRAVVSMGFREADIEYIDLPSTFPAANRLIKFDGVGRINKDNQDELVPEIASKIEKILCRHPHSKGIIHSPSYHLTKTVVEAMAITYRPRLLVQDKDGNNAKKILERHTSSPDPTVLFTPGMKEGIDLKNELSRFQIIIKCPYPNLGDPATKALADKDYLWYITRTLIDFMQMYGRSIRSADDYAETICLDDNMRIMIREYKNFLPGYVMEAVRWVG